MFLFLISLKALYYIAMIKNIIYDWILKSDTSTLSMENGRRWEEFLKKIQSEWYSIATPAWKKIGYQRTGKQKSNITILEISYDYKDKGLKYSGGKGIRIGAMSRQKKRRIT